MTPNSQHQPRRTGGKFAYANLMTGWGVGCMRLLGGTTIVLVHLTDYIARLQVRRLHHNRDHAGLATLGVDLSKLEEYALTCVKVHASAVATYGPARSRND